MTKLPRWADLVLVPAISLLLAGLISALVILAILLDRMSRVSTGGPQ